MSARALLASVLLVACSGKQAPQTAVMDHGGHHHGPAHASHAASPPSSIDEKLAEVARVHGGAGPWAVLGYRMGEHAIAVLALKRGSFDLEVIHHSPKEVQYSCIADGAAASTGASLGKLNLALSEAPLEETRTIYRNKASGTTITLRPAAVFAQRFRDVPRDKLAEAGREAMALPDAEVFEVVQTR